MAAAIIDHSNVIHDYSLSETAYSYGYDLRLKYSTFMQDSLDWVAKNAASLFAGQSTRVLSLGCGNGLFDREFIKIIEQQKNTNWSYTGIDFSATDLDQFRQKIASLDGETQAKIFLECKKFTPCTEQGMHYDLITMIHFLHSFDAVLPIIQNAMRHLLPAGKLLIIQQKKQGMSELKASLNGLLPNRKFQSSDRIKTLLHSEGIRFSAHKLDTRFDISIMQKMSLDTLLLMSFCLSNDLSLLNTQQQEKIRQTFLSYSQPANDGSLIFHEQMEVIICSAVNYSA